MKRLKTFSIVFQNSTLLVFLLPSWAPLILFEGSSFSAFHKNVVVELFQLTIMPDTEVLTWVLVFPSILSWVLSLFITLSALTLSTATAAYLLARAVFLFIREHCARCCAGPTMDYTAVALGIFTWIRASCLFRTWCLVSWQGQMEELKINPQTVPLQYKTEGQRVGGADKKVWPLGRIRGRSSEVRWFRQVEKGIVFPSNVRCGRFVWQRKQK